MPRARGGDKKKVAARAQLESATAALVRIEYVIERITRLRIEQARERSGLYELLDPVLDELSEMVSAAQSAKVEIASVLGGLQV